MRTTYSKGCSRQAGVTLIELLVAMVILGIVSTMLITGWVNLQRTSAYAVSTSNARATARDAMSRASGELRGAQPTSLPTAMPSATATLAPQPPVTMAAPMEVRFNSSFNSADANSDGSGVTALRPTRIWLDDTLQSLPYNTHARTLYLQRDMNRNGSFTDTGDRSIVLATNVVNDIIADATNGTSGTAYTPMFRYAYRDSDDDVLWSDNADSSLAVASIVAIRVRLIIDANMARVPSPVDITTTVRLRNASSD